MFDSVITAKEFIDNLKSEVDVALDISDMSYLGWLNTAEQFIYGSVIKEEGVYTAENTENISLPIKLEGENNISQADVVTVYAKFPLNKRVQLMHVTTANGPTFKDVYFVKGDKLCIKPSFPCTEADIIYIRRPIIKSISNWETEKVKMPVEYIDLIAAKLRGEAYKLANEDSIAAKWFNDYNALLQDFNAWCSMKRANVGM